MRRSRKDGNRLLPTKAKFTLGMCQKAGKAVSGDFLIQEALKKKQKIYLLLLAEDVSERTRKEALFRAEKYKIELIERGSKIELGEAVGKSERSMIAITDEGLSRSLKKNLLEGC